MANLVSPQPRANAEVSVEYKVNLGNYESVTIAVKLAEGANDGEAGPALIDRLMETVTDSVVEQVNAVRPKSKK